MFCTNCGSEIPDGSKFCVNCGASLVDGGQASPLADIPDPVIEEPAPKAPVSAAAPEQPQQVDQEPVYEQAPVQPQPQVYQGYAAAAAPTYQQPVYPAQAEPENPRKFKRTRWPSSCGTMGILHFVFFLFSAGCWVLYYADEFMPGNQLFSAIIAPRIIPLLIALAIPVLFLIHTKKLAFLTAIPMILMLVMDWINNAELMRMGIMEMQSELYVTNVLPLVLLTILAVLYLIQMLVRPRNAALAVVYLILAIIYMILMVIVLMVNLIQSRYMSGFIVFANVLNTIGAILLQIGYIVAMFSSRKR